MQVEQVLNRLEALASPQIIEFKQNKFGISANNSLGIFQKDLKILAKKIGPNDDLALELYATGIYEARLMTCRLYTPALINKTQMNQWAGDFENWEICDSFCMGFFTKSPYAIEKALKWSSNNKEFVKRAAFVIMAAYGMADKYARNKVFEQFFVPIEREANDERVYVKKSLSWALRSIGKRNVTLKELAIETAQKIGLQGTKSAKWIAKDVLRELHSSDVKMQDHPRPIYRPISKA